MIFLGKDNEGPDRAGLASIRSRHIPLVVYDCQMKPGTYSSVDLDYEGGARFLVERILEKHPGKLLYLRPDIAKAQEEERERGVREAMAQHPECQLSICTVPVTLENLESWDIRYSVGMTDQGRSSPTALSRPSARQPPGSARGCRGLELVHLDRPLPQLLPICGPHLRRACQQRRNPLLPGLYLRLPNVEVGRTCADALLRLIEESLPRPAP